MSFTFVRWKLEADHGSGVLDQGFVHGDLQWGDQWSLDAGEPEASDSWELGGKMI